MMSLPPSRRFVLLGFLAFLTTVPLAEAQVLDATFDPNANDTVHVAVPLADGKILIGGDFTQVGGIARNRLARLNPDGSVDLTFDPDVTGFSDPPIFPTDFSGVKCLMVQADGKIILGGDFTHIGGTPRNRVARLNADGTLDTSFATGVSSDMGNGMIDRSTVDALAQQEDGKVIIGGDFLNVERQTTHGRLARLKTNGTLDTSFNAASTNIKSVQDLECLPNGQVVVSGQFSNEYKVMKLNADGTRDPTFAIANVTGRVLCLHTLPEGKTLLGSGFTHINGIARSSLARLNADGSLDTQFTTTGSVGSCLALQAGGSIVSSFSQLAADGSFTSLLPTQAGGICYGISLQKNGHILLCGDFTTVGGIPRSGIARIIPAEPPAESLTANSSTGVIQWLRSGSAPEVEKVTFDVWDNATLTWQPCGKASAISGGWQLTGLTLPGSSWIRAQGRVQGGTQSGSSWHAEQIHSYGTAVAELEVEAAGQGSLTDHQDTLSFGTQNWLVPGAAKELTLRNTGTADLTNIAITVIGEQGSDFGISGPAVTTLAAGASTTFTVTFTPQGASSREGTLLISSNDADERPFRVALTGTGVHEDPTLNLAIEGSYVYAATQHPDGRILLVGYLDSINHSTAATDLAWVNETGLASLPFSDSFRINQTAMMPDGKLLTTQSTFGYSKTVKRWTTSGSNDGTFVGRSEFNDGHSMIIYPTGEIIASIRLRNSSTNESFGNVYRFSADGSQVTTQNMGVGSYVNALALQEDGCYLVGGYFITPDGKKGLVRFLPDHNRDTSFMSAGSSSWFSDLTVNTLAIQPDGKILIGGDMEPVGGITREGIARVHADGSLDLAFAPKVNGLIESMILQADGKILIAGQFTEVNGIRRRHIARLFSDGSLDPQFDPDSDNWVHGLSLQKDGSILAGGIFSQIGNVSRQFLARLPNNIPVSESLTVSGNHEIQWLRGGSAAEISHVSFESWNGNSWSPLGRASRMPGGWQMTGLNLPANSWVRARGRAYGGLKNGSSYLVEKIVRYGSAQASLVVERPSGTALGNRAQKADFGGVLVNASSSVITYRLRNTGPQTLTGLILTKDGPQASNFTASTLPSTLAPGASATLTVTFNPKALGERFAALHIESNDLNNSPFDIFLTGIGLNNAPTITGLTDITINEDDLGLNIPFTIGDVETPLADLTVSVTSSNTNLTFGTLSVGSGTGRERTFSIYPRANRFGTSTITVRVGDGTTTTAVPITLTVRSVNDLPTVTGLTTQTILEDSATTALPFTIADVETPAEELTLTATSSNTSLVPEANIVLGGSGEDRTITLTPLPNKNGSSVITIRVNDGTASRNFTFTLTVTAVNDAPTISSIPNQTTDEDTATAAIPFTIADLETALSALVVTVRSSNSTLTPSAAFTLGGAEANRTLVITPAANRNGNATITVSVSDGALTVERTFSLTVNAINDAPTITGLIDRHVFENTATGTVNFNVQDAESVPSALTVTAASSNTALVPNENILLGGTNNIRTLNITPAPGQSGTTLITLTASDGSAQRSASFTLTVANLPIITQHPTTTQVSEGAELRLRVIATGTGTLRYQWRKNEQPIPLATASEWVVAATEIRHEGTYDVIVTNPAGSVPSQPAAVTVHRTPFIQQQPLPQIIHQGSALELSVSALGRAPLFYQWKKGKTNLPNSRADHYQVTEAATATHAGSYSVVISGSSTSKESAPAHVAVVAPALPSLSLKKGGAVKLASKVTAPKVAGVTLSYLWRKNGTPLTNGLQENGALISGAATATLSITQTSLEDSGDYDCRVTLNTPDHSPFLFQSPTRVSIVDEVPVIEEVTLPTTLLVSEPVEAEVRATQAPKTYSAVGLPKGLSLNTSTGRITGRPLQTSRYDAATETYQPFKITFFARNDVGLSTAKEMYLTIEKTPFEGSYIGLVERESHSNGDLGGRLDFTVAPTGVASGSLQVANQRYAFKMALDTQVADPGSFQATVSIPRKKPFLTALRLTLSANASVITGSLQEISSSEETPTDPAALLIHRVTPAAEIAGAISGDYTVGFPSATPLAEGFARVKVSKTGTSQWTGRAGDGSTFTCASKLTTSAQTVLFHALLDKDQGSLQGAVSIHPTTQDLAPLNEATIPLDCLLLPRLAGTRDTTFPGGVPLRALTLVGNKYSKVENFDPLLESPGLDQPSAALSFMGDLDLNLAAFSQSFAVKAPAKIVMPKAGPLNPYGVTLTLASTTGLYSGKYKDLTSGRSGSFSGVLVRHLGTSEKRGFGQFMIPLGTVKDPVHVGTVQLQDLLP
ncbi:choice-of-anchor D domain-containing protein [Prosthecobacter dejongeii]|uniref:Putative delta-60 repeat protein n=1 Tax=Prosthecobacter dejongeii TaxID=48465 RepID=A0A7W7YHN6_9BACT|nr:choice-of-anchor D domain-containing protein [Prosthecobacter dejongeii]MBB5036309.1 putative delta-60 repeat protein [Prosthecobacter dejongeii]